jgi:hypothetical protein
MMRDIQRDWEHWSRIERILAAALVVGAVSVVIGTLCLLRA